MPIYEYRCPDCQHQFEALQSMSADPIGECPSCGSDKVARVLHAPAIHFKGSGFYNTDYGTRKRAAEKSSSNGGDSGSGSSSGGDSGSGGGEKSSSSGGDSGSSSSKTVGLDKV